MVWVPKYAQRLHLSCNGGVDCSSYGTHCAEREIIPCVEPATAKKDPVQKQTTHFPASESGEPAKQVIDHQRVKSKLSFSSSGINTGSDANSTTRFLVSACDRVGPRHWSSSRCVFRGWSRLPSLTVAGDGLASDFRIGMLGRVADSNHPSAATWR